MFGGLLVGLPEVLPGVTDRVDLLLFVVAVVAVVLLVHLAHAHAEADGVLPLDFLLLELLLELDQLPDLFELLHIAVKLLLGVDRLLGFLVFIDT